MEFIFFFPFAVSPQRGLSILFSLSWLGCTNFLVIVAVPDGFRAGLGQLSLAEPSSTKTKHEGAGKALK